MARTASISRKTGETDIQIEVNLDGTGVSRIDTGVGFFDHMLTALSRHSLMDLAVSCKGDTWVDDHHSVEDVGIVSGRGELYWDVPIGPRKVGTFDTELGKEFFIGFARQAGMTLHLRELCGENAHHILEATFKACARALRVAFEDDPRVEGIPSTKGSL